MKVSVHCQKTFHINRTCNLFKLYIDIFRKIPFKVNSIPHKRHDNEACINSMLACQERSLYLGEKQGLFPNKVPVRTMCSSKFPLKTLSRQITSLEHDDSRVHPIKIIANIMTNFNIEYGNSVKKLISKNKTCTPI